MHSCNTQWYTAGQGHHETEAKHKYFSVELAQPGNTAPMPLSTGWAYYAGMVLWHPVASWACARLCSTARARFAVLLSLISCRMPQCHTHLRSLRR